MRKNSDLSFELFVIIIEVTALKTEGPAGAAPCVGDVGPWAAGPFSTIEHGPLWCNPKSRKVSWTSHSKRANYKKNKKVFEMTATLCQLQIKNGLLLTDIKKRFKRINFVRSLKSSLNESLFSYSKSPISGSLNI